MRTRSELERLEAAGRPLLAEADSLVGSDEEARILERILASPRSAAGRRNSRLRVVLAACAAGAVAAAIAAVSSGVFRSSHRPTRTVRHQLVLSGSRISTAGYHFRTPAGFKDSTSSCVAASSSSGPVTVMNGFTAAASADGGCVEAFLMESADGGSPAQNGAEPVPVGGYQGYFVPPDASGQSTLYVQLPTSADSSEYLALFAEGLTEDQLIAIAESGLPSSPTAGTTQTCTANCG